MDALAPLPGLDAPAPLSARERQRERERARYAAKRAADPEAMRAREQEKASKRRADPEFRARVLLTSPIWGRKGPAKDRPWAECGRCGSKEAHIDEGRIVCVWCDDD